MTLDELAAGSGLTVRMIRYYRRRGVLHPPAAGQKGCYDATHLTRLVLIRQLREKGTPLEQIRRSIAGEASTSAGEDEFFRQRIECVNLLPSVMLRTPVGYFSDEELAMVRDSVKDVLARRNGEIR